ncbi:MAG: hypothetical protein ACLR06_16015 [Christensenellaceae bacterium]
MSKKKKKKKKEKVIYYDDNSTISDMSQVTRIGQKTVGALGGAEAKIDLRGKVENLLVGSKANAVADVRRSAHFAASLSFAHLYFLT